MVVPSDKDYKATKQIMLGKATMNPDFVELARFIDSTFGVKTINIIYDTLEKRPRLNICFEFEQEKQRFNKKPGHFNFDGEKQELIADKFKQTVKGPGTGKTLLGALTRSLKYKTDNVWVYYSAFEPVAKIEANENIPKDKLAQLKKELNNEELWELSRAFSGVTFFLYTNEQVKRYENSETRKAWAGKYFDMLAPYNEFGYFKRDKFTIYLDSKENFDTNYAGNWYYYYK